MFSARFKTTRYLVFGDWDQNHDVFHGLKTRTTPEESPDQEVKKKQTLTILLDMKTTRFG